MPIEESPTFVVRTEAQKAASDNGYRIERGGERGWLGYASTTAPGAIWMPARHTGRGYSRSSIPASPPR